MLIDVGLAGTALLLGRDLHLTQVGGPWYRRDCQYPSHGCDHDGDYCEILKEVIVPLFQ